MSKPQGMVEIIKTVPGTLILRFQRASTFDGDRRFYIPANQERIRVPLEYAASIFTMPETESMYKKGYFKFNDRDKEKVFQYGEELLIYFPEQENGAAANSLPIRTKFEMTNLVKLGRLADIEEIVLYGTAPQKELLLEVIRTEKNNVTLDILNIVEEHLGVALREG